MPKLKPPSPAGRIVGIDFGTSNSVMALSDGPGESDVVRFGRGTNFPSIVCFYPDVDARGRQTVVGLAGPEAIAAYRELGSDCRIVKSIKTYLANPSVKETRIFGERFTISDICSVILTEMRAVAEAEKGALGDSVFSGRPVEFAGLHADEPLALGRLRDAYARAEFDRVEFRLEPLAAAYFHVRKLKQRQTCLIADLGGGTSDFSVVRFEPTDRGPKTVPLAQSGIGIAGDRLDYRIIQHAIAPELGQGSYYHSMGKRLPIPMYIYGRFQQWSELSLLKEGRTLQDLREILRTAENKPGIAGLIDVIENERGFDLYRAVGKAKARLSTQDSAPLRFSLQDVEIDKTIYRDEFERWIETDVEQIAETLDRAFTETDLSYRDVSKVFMTGGTSLVPAIHRVFAERFGPEVIETGNEFVSVAGGLALIGRETHDQRAGHN